MKKKTVCMALFAALLASMPCRAEGSSLYLDVKFPSNFIFDTYGVDVCLDGENLISVPHGEDFTYLVENVQDGKHTVSFIKQGNADVRGESEIDVNGDVTLQCTISTHGSEVSVSDENIINDVSLSALTVPDVCEISLKNAADKLKETGFVNVTGKSGGKTVYASHSYIVTAQGIKAGTTADKSADIILTCKRIDEYLSQLSGMNVSEAQEEASDKGFEAIFINGVTWDKMQDRIKSFSEKEREDWKVTEIDNFSDTGTDVTLYIENCGEIPMPDYTGMNLSDAENDFAERLGLPNLDYRAYDDSIVWIDSNWEVVTQNVRPGDMITRNSVVTLTVQSYDDIEKNGYADVPRFRNDDESELNSSDTESGTSEAETSDKEAGESQFEHDTENESDPEMESKTETETEAAKIVYIDVSSAETVMKVQEALNELGYECGTADGIAGSKTQNAVSMYRTDHGLTAGNAIDVELVESLGVSFGAEEHSPETEKSVQESEQTVSSVPVSSSSSLSGNSIDKDLMVVMCEPDREHKTEYVIAFAELDEKGNVINFLTFDTYKERINPRTMGDEFNAIGPLPSWFYVGATVHVKAELTSDGIKTSGCTVTPAN